MIKHSKFHHKYRKPRTLAELEKSKSIINKIPDLVEVKENAAKRKENSTSEMLQYDWTHNFSVTLKLHNIIETGK